MRIYLQLTRPILDVDWSVLAIDLDYISAITEGYLKDNTLLQR